MKCTIKGCSGNYEKKTIDHVERHNNEPIVISGVPALVCDVCGDTVLEAETIKQLDELLKKHPKPKDFAPVFKYKINKRAVA